MLPIAKRTKNQLPWLTPSSTECDCIIVRITDGGAEASSSALYDHVLDIAIVPGHKRWITAKNAFLVSEYLQWSFLVRIDGTGGAVDETDGEVKPRC